MDQEGVPVSHIEAVKRSGLLGLTAPAAYGGSAAPPTVVREVSEILAGACGSTWFVQSQHHTPVQVLARGEAAARDRPGLRPSGPVRLAALTAARTVSLRLDGLRTPTTHSRCASRTPTGPPPTGRRPSTAARRSSASPRRHCP